MIGVLLADDDQLTRAGLRLILESDPELTVVGEAADGHEALQLARALRPRVVLMDIRTPGMDGLEATRRIVEATGEDCRVLILTTFELDEYVFGALRAGAIGFLLKRSSPRCCWRASRWSPPATACWPPRSPGGSSRSSPAGPARRPTRPPRWSP
jgi:DNA-binding NarL/FixJ family response regulator